jgi:hypothetical protein
MARADACHPLRRGAKGEDGDGHDVNGSLQKVRITGRSHMSATGLASKIQF